MPDWATRALARGRAAVMAAPPSAQNGTAVTVAGVRGASASASELYWKDADSAPQELVAEAERAEQAGEDSRAAEFYARALVVGATGRVADRAVVGLAVQQMKRGDLAGAQARLTALVARAPDHDLKYAAALPLAICLASNAHRTDAEALLKELMAEAPDHPLASQADALLWVWQEGR